jgi:hypothetical protein
MLRMTKRGGRRRRPTGPHPCPLPPRPRTSTDIVEERKRSGKPGRTMFLPCDIERFLYVAGGRRRHAARSRRTRCRTFLRMLGISCTGAGSEASIRNRWAARTCKTRWRSDELSHLCSDKVSHRFTAARRLRLVDRLAVGVPSFFQVASVFRRSAERWGARSEGRRQREVGC